MALSVSIPTTDGPIDIELSEDQNKLFVLGANGTGKSALLHQIHQQHPQRAHKVAAYRHTYFESGTPDLSGGQYKSATEEIRRWDRDARSRYTEQSGGLRAIRSIAALMQNRRGRDRSATALLDEGKNDEAEEYVQDNRDPFYIINGLLEASNLGVRVSIEPDDPDTIVARHMATDQMYTIERLSDGERSALLLAAETLTADKDTVFLLDEPERHLHRSIISPLLSELFAARADCYFVISTHEVLLPEDCGPATALILRGCEFDTGGVANSWQFDVVPPEVGIDDDIKVDVWGARRKLLYVEGNALGADERLYSTLFPEVTVKAKGSCTWVIRSVEDVRSESELHWLEVYGLIDGDTRTPEETADLEAQGIFALPLRAVESIYYGKEMREAIASRQSDHLGDPREELVAKARHAVLENVESMKELPADQQSALSELVERQDAEGIVADFPIGKSTIPQAVATCLGYKDKKQYERAVRTLIKTDGDARNQVAAACGAVSDILCG
ncbi:AAA family ATPase [Candidatus Poriferisocius sp.]|uniref:AAA family ATPase n=1 Tax=Candidatus Poriferisocius sp. TaxID=3101276 RepID=UPI003B026563